VTHHAVENLSDFNVSLIVGGYYFPTWAILALVVGDLANVLGEFVDGQTRAGIDGLTLD
jgi:hypothetical protein